MGGAAAAASAQSGHTPPRSTSSARRRRRKTSCIRSRAHSAERRARLRLRGGGNEARLPHLPQQDVWTREVAQDTLLDVLERAVTPAVVQYLLGAREKALNTVNGAGTNVRTRANLFLHYVSTILTLAIAKQLCQLSLFIQHWYIARHIDFVLVVVNYSPKRFSKGFLLDFFGQ